MKNLQGKEIKRGDQVIAKVADGNYQAGQVHQLNTRSVPDPEKKTASLIIESVRISGYSLNVSPDCVVSAGDAYEALASSLKPNA